MSRGFSEEVERVANRWREAVFNETDWELRGAAPTGEADPVYVFSPSLNWGGVAKPRNPKPPVTNYPRAPFEKICADLAHDLNLPVPPVTLWRPPAKLKLPAQMCVSIFPGPPPQLQWRDLEDSAALRELMKPTLREWSCRLAVFDSWVANTDRKNEGNLIVWRPDDASPPSLAYIDFSHALSVGWPKDVERIQVVRPYPDPAYEHSEEMEEMFNRINGLSTIEAIVDRVPDDFLAPERRAAVANGLLTRRSTLRKTFVSFLGELSWRP